VSITLDLPGDLEQKLALEAAERGMPLTDYAIELLSRGTSATGEEDEVRTGADLVDFWEREGLIGYRDDITDSVAYAQEIRRQAERRIRE